MTSALLDALPAPTKLSSFRDIMSLFGSFRVVLDLSSRLSLRARDQKAHWLICNPVGCHSAHVEARRYEQPRYISGTFLVWMST